MLGQFTTIAAAAVLVLWSIGASALPNPAIPLPDCGCIDRAEMSALQERIAKAPSLEEALIGFILGILPGIILLLILY